VFRRQGNNDWADGGKKTRKVMGVPSKNIKKRGPKWQKMATVGEKKKKRWG